jgi:transcriptional regulator with XRE-family HTH domain
MSDAASTLNTILEQEGTVLEDNLFAREQMAKLMGMDEATLSRALQKKKLLSSQPNLNILMNLNGTELQKAADGMLKNGEMTQEAFNELTELNDTRTTDQIMRQQLIAATEAKEYLKAMLTTDQYNNVVKSREALTGDQMNKAFLDLNKEDMIGLGNTENLTEIATTTAAILKLMPVRKMPSYTSKSTTGTPVDTAPDAVIPAGYGDRILTFPEDTLQADVAFKNNDTIIAGTSLAGNNSSTSPAGAAGNNSSTSPGGATDNVLLAVGRMIVAAINSKGSNLFAATTMNDSTYQT